MSALKLFRTIKTGSTIFTVTTILCLISLTANAGQQNKGEQLNHKVFSLMQQCDDTKNKDELLTTIATIESLIEQIKKGQHKKKKLYIIRLKKSQNMCQYLLQLKEE